ncbi:MAG: rod shape-determining protein [Candidatus Dojkabacteria bacterium]|nr:rod shape-determining protein [Candidatus Dojkabacteria bacterium]
MLVKRIGLDLGTSNSLVFVEGRGIVINEPTVVAVSVEDRKVLAIGTEAKEMIGKVPENIIAKRPLREGVIASYRLTEALLKYFMNKAIGRVRILKPEVMISVPAGITTVEERAVIEAALSAGAGKVYLLPEPIAAAIGAKLPINTSAGNMIVNMGGGTTEIGVISMNGIVSYESVRIAGDGLNEAIISHVRKDKGLLIGEQMAEKIKIAVGSATKMEKPLEVQIKGRDASTGMPRSMIVNSNDVVEAVTPILKQILVSIRGVLEKTPPELSSDIIDRGMVLSGGTSQLRNIDELFTKAIGVPAHVVDDPLFCVVKGTASALQHLEVIRRSLKGT